MIRLDLRGRPCPEPVIEVKKAIDASPYELLEVLVDDAAAKANVARYAGTRGYSCSDRDMGDGCFLLELGPSESAPESGRAVKESMSLTGDEKILIKDYGMGTPDRELGEVLMRTFFQVIPQHSSLPGRIVFMHGAVKHTVEGAENLEIIKKLADYGVDIVVCGTCLDYYGLKGKLAVGRISNFFEISQILLSQGKTLTL